MDIDVFHEKHSENPSAVTSVSGRVGGCMHRVGCVVSICRPTLFFLGAPKTDRREPSWPNTRDKVASQGSSESEGS